MFSRSAQDSTPVWRIYNKDWRLLRSEFESFKLYFYAMTWARSIFQGTAQRKPGEDEADETQAETYVSKASCAMRTNSKNYTELVFTVPDGIPPSWRAGTKHIGIFYVLKNHCHTWQPPLCYSLAPNSALFKLMRFLQ